MCANLYGLYILVVPLEGTWIEIGVAATVFTLLRVVPLEGTWIEIYIQKCCYSTSVSSYPLRVRGLKFLYPRGCSGGDLVVPLEGTWIEIIGTPK